MSRACVICKHQNPDQQHRFSATTTAYIYMEEGKTTKISLCFTHERELFLIGQYKFMERYKNLPRYYIGSDELRFFEHWQQLLRSRGISAGW